VFPSLFAILGALDNEQVFRGFIVAMITVDALLRVLDHCRPFCRHHKSLALFGVAVTVFLDIIILVLYFSTLQLREDGY
jgi:hypothetical protein